jgi:hypothetical protein
MEKLAAPVSRAAQEIGAHIRRTKKITIGRHRACVIL